MKVTSERLAAFADGELPESEAAEVAAQVERDPALAEEVRRHRALKARLAGHFAPLAQEPVPEALAALLRPPSAQVVDLAAATRRKTERRASLPRWTWFVGPALAASLVLMVALPGGNRSGIDSSLAAALDTQLAGTGTADDPAQVLLSFRDSRGSLCRAFTQGESSGIACKGADGWQMAAESEGGPAGGPAGDYRMAGSADILARAQEMASGPALDREEEEQAIGRGWRVP